MSRRWKLAVSQLVEIKNQREQRRSTNRNLLINFPRLSLRKRDFHQFPKQNVRFFSLISEKFGSSPNDLVEGITSTKLFLRSINQ